MRAEKFQNLTEEQKEFIRARRRQYRALRKGKLEKVETKNGTRIKEVGTGKFVKKLIQE